MSRGHFRDQGPLDCKVYVGGLGEDASRHDLWEAFEEYGKLKNVWVARNPPGFAFIEFEDHNDAADAVEHLDQRVICNRRVKVQLSTGESRRRGGGGGGGFRGGRSDQCCYECGRPGHIARDCRSRGYGGGGGGSRGGRYSSRRSRSRSIDRRRSPSRSRSKSPARRSRSRSGSYKG